MKRETGSRVEDQSSLAACPGWRGGRCPAVSLALLTLTTMLACGWAVAAEVSAPADGDYRGAMRDLVAAISAYAKTAATGFVVIPQNGLELVSQTGDPHGPPASAYLAAIDAVGQESLFFGQPKVDSPTPVDETAYLLHFTDRVQAMGKAVLVIDYCRTASRVDAAYRRNAGLGYVGYAADRRELDRIAAYPAQPFRVHPGPVTTLDQVRNFTYLINTGAFSNREDFLAALEATAFDLLVVDLFFSDGKPLTPADIQRLQHKANGARRLVVAYMSIGEAEAYRYYWKPVWHQFPPSWMAAENPKWKGNFKVRYWDPGWRRILMGEPDAYLDRILAAGFDGVYLDIVDAFHHFEQARSRATVDRCVAKEMRPSQPAPPDTK